MNDRYDDESLMLELAQALREVAPHVDDVATRARSAFTWRSIDEDLLMAELMFDSAHSPEPTLTRAGTGNDARVLVFTAQLRTVEIEVLADRVVGQFLPQSAGQVEVESDQGIIATVEVDELGFFVIEPVPQGVVRLRCTTPTTRLVTDWVRL